MADRNFALLVELKADIEQFKKGMDGAKKQNNSLLGSFKKIAPAMVAAFSVAAIANFTKEAVMLAATLEGVKNAFDRLANSEQILKDLKIATRGTVSEFKLMQMTVEASNMGLPVENLATMFEFATKQAIRTGKSVDYLIEQLVLGIGRKSAQRLDDLGISLVQIQEEMKKTGDFATAITNIINDNLEAMGNIGDTASTKIQQARADWEDFKTATGTKMLGIFSTNYQYSKSLGELQKNDLVPWLDKLWATTTMNYKAVIKLADEWEEFNKVADETKKITGEITWVFREGIKSGIDWAKVNEDIFKQWVKENDIIRARIKLQEDLTDSLNRSKFAMLEMLAAMGGEFKNPYAGKKSDGLTDNEYLYQDEEEMPGESELDGMVEKFWEIENETQRFIDNMNGMLEGFVEGAITNLAAGLGEAFSSGDWESFTEDILSTFGNFMVQMGGLLIAYGIGMDTFKKALTNPYAAIAAGAALAAIGGAIIGAHDSFASNGSASGGGAYVGNITVPENSVTFEIEGDKLVGVLDNHNRKLNTYK